VRSGKSLGPFDLDFSPSLGFLGALSERVSILIDRQKEIWTRDRSAWVVVPTVREGSLCWLLIASDAEGERRAREVVGAFIGPTVGSIEPGQLALDPSNIVDTRLQQADIDRIVPVKSAGTDTAEFVEALELMTAVRTGEPELRREVEDPIGYLLRDFRLALSAADPQNSERLLERLEATGLLASENLRFLRVERLARLGRWHELGMLPWFTDMARARRPRYITEHLLEALWRREFDDVALITETGAALRRFQESDLEVRYRPLLDSIDVPSSTGARRVVWLSAVLSSNEARQRRLLESVEELESSLLERLAGTGRAHAEPVTKLGALAQARSLLDAGEFVDAIEVAERTPGDPGLAAVAVRAAFELADPDLASRAIALVDSVQESMLPTTPGFRRNLRDVRQWSTNRCSSWTAWLSRVCSDVRWPEAADVARDLSAGWGIDEFRQESTAEAAANNLLLAAENVNAPQIKAALDLFCDLAGKLTESVGATSLIDAVLLVLSLQDNPSFAVRNAFFSLAVQVIRTGPSATRYADLVKTATGLWERVCSRETAAWALDVADLLAMSPAPDPAIRTAFISSVGNGVRGFAARLAGHERSLLEALAAECGTTVGLPPLREEPSSPLETEFWGALTGRLVGLYSLLGGVGARFAERVRGLNPETRVEYNSDTVATDALRSLAKTADFFIVDTWHASHAATGAIDGVRGRERQLFPSGRGLSSFIAVLHDALEREATSTAA
jgi:hypothetical protein